MTDEADRVEFDDVVALALACSASADVPGDAAPSPDVKQQLLRRIHSQLRDGEAGQRLHGDVTLDQSQGVAHRASRDIGRVVRV